ncbi:hypothetical protein [Streptomyces sp. ACT015]|uniref:hypothetical protein n=1 Tax=Streptomyces sp. ACT015 TaxID=3134807 RepID=UPI003D17C5E8
MERYFWHLPPAQADGMACVVCGASFLAEKITTVAVGRSAADESPVYACAGPCVQVITDTERVVREMQAEQDGPAFLEIDESEAGPFTVDGHFGSLLRDLRTLSGCEALLTTLDEPGAVRYMVSLTARHAEAATLRARLLLARLGPPADGGPEQDGAGEGA